MEQNEMDRSIEFLMGHDQHKVGGLGLEDTFETRSVTVNEGDVNSFLPHGDDSPPKIVSIKRKKFKSYLDAVDNPNDIDFLINKAFMADIFIAGDQKQKEDLENMTYKDATHAQKRSCA